MALIPRLASALRSAAGLNTEAEVKGYFALCAFSVADKSSCSGARPRWRKSAKSSYQNNSPPEVRGPNSPDLRGQRWERNVRRKRMRSLARLCFFFFSPGSACCSHRRSPPRSVTFARAWEPFCRASCSTGSSMPLARKFSSSSCQLCRPESLPRRLHARSKHCVSTCAAAQRTTSWLHCSPSRRRSPRTSKTRRSIPALLQVYSKSLGRHWSMCQAASGSHPALRPAS
jgi:hypothetical protein